MLKRKLFTQKINSYFINIHPITWIIVVNALILCVSSIVRHNFFKTASADLGIFDQVVYLISQGQNPISTLLDFHILGDHAAWMWYPLALLYKIYPTVYWLFIVQSIALSLGALPIYLLARQASLTKEISLAIAIVYLLYPLVFNINLYDFHLDTLLPIAILGAVWAARNSKISLFCVCIFIVLGCKAVFSLTIAAMGLWLIFGEQRRLYGLIAFISGSIWFIFANRVIIPFFGGSAASLERHAHRFSSLGNSFPEIFKNLLFHPGIFLSQIFTLDNLFYLFLLLIPVIWGLSLSGIAPLFSAIPCLLINLLATSLQQKDLFFQYSLPILPFLFIALIQSLASGKGWLKTRKLIILWSLTTYFALAKYGYFWSIYLESIDTWSAMREAISLVKTSGGVYTTAEMTPHLTHRKLIKFTNVDIPPKDLNEFDYILLNWRHPGWLSNRDFVNNLIKEINNNQLFSNSYKKDDVYLFTKKVINSKS